MGSEAAGSIMDRYLRRCGSLYCRQFGRNRQAAPPYRDFLPARSKRPHRRKRRVVADLSDGRQGRGTAGKIGFLSDKQTEGKKLDAGASVAPFSFFEPLTERARRQRHDPYIPLTAQPHRRKGIRQHRQVCGIGKRPSENTIHHVFRRPSLWLPHEAVSA